MTIEVTKTATSELKTIDGNHTIHVTLTEDWVRIAASGVVLNLSMDDWKNLDYRMREMLAMVNQ